jgi:hypothetical protein
VLYQLSYAHHIALLVPKLPNGAPGRTPTILLYCFYLCQLPVLAHPAGLEPATIRLEGGCSIQLSYGRLINLYSLTITN